MMMICPKCGADYRDGFAECSDCRVPLRSSPQDTKERDKFRSWSTVLDTGDQTILDSATGVLQQAGIEYRTDETSRFRSTPDGPRSASAFNPVLLQVRQRDSDNAYSILRSDSRFAASIGGKEPACAAFLLIGGLLGLLLVVFVFRPAWAPPFAVLLVLTLLLSVPFWHRRRKKLLR